MAQLITTVCDVCQAHDHSATGEPVEITLAGSARVIDLCEGHRVEMIDPLLDLLTEHGRPLNSPGLVTPPKKRLGRPPLDADITWVCSVPTCVWETTSEGNGQRNRHCRTEHNTEYWAMEQYGWKAALAGAGMQYACTVGPCDHMANAPRFGRIQGFTQHLLSAHNMTVDEARERIPKMKMKAA